MKKRRKKSDNVSNGGGENPKMSEIKIGTFENPRGVSIFRQCVCLHIYGRLFPATTFFFAAGHIFANWHERAAFQSVGVRAADWQRR